MTENEVKNLLKTIKGVSVRSGNGLWHAYYKNDFHLIVGDHFTMSYQYRYQDPMIGTIFNKWNFIRYENVTEDDINTLINSVDKLL